MQKNIEEYYKNIEPLNWPPTIQDLHSKDQKLPKLLETLMAGT